ncbi:hypothetical protein [Novosphingobium sp. ZW T3_23]
MVIDLFARLRPDADLHPQFLKTRDDPKMAPVMLDAGQAMAGEFRQ